MSEGKALERRQQKKVTERDKEVFLDGLCQGMTMKKAAELAAHPYDTFRKVRERDSEFNEMVLRAHEIGTDVLEEEAFRRGTEGFKKPVIGKIAPGIDGHLKDENGEYLYEMVYSDRLLEILLKGRRPEYREKQQVDITNQTLNVSLDDRSAALSDVARVLRDAGVTLEATEGITDGRGSSYQELPEP